MSWENFFDIIIRTTVVFTVILFGLRMTGKRHVAQLSLVDLVLILLISNAVQNAMVGSDSSLVGGIVAAVTLLILSTIFSKIQYRFKPFEKLFEPDPTILVHNGKALKRNLEREEIALDELERAIREHGIEKIEDVQSAIMEADGTISVIPINDHVKHIESFKYLRMKRQKERRK